MTGCNIFLKLFHDRLEIQSPGGLPKGITLETLGTRSSRRNPLLADIMARAGVGEKWEQGFHICAVKVFCMAVVNQLSKITNFSLLFSLHILRLSDKNI